MEAAALRTRTFAETEEETPVSGELFPGRRVRDIDPVAFVAGDFGQWQGVWYARTPNGYLANLELFKIKEHAGGTITVDPAIGVSTNKEGVETQVWYGYLEHGIWRTV